MRDVDAFVKVLHFDDQIELMSTNETKEAIFKNLDDDLDDEQIGQIRTLTCLTI